MITKVTVTMDDGSEEVFTNAPAAATDTEVKVEKSDGTEEVFDPKA